MVDHLRADVKGAGQISREAARSGPYTKAWSGVLQATDLGLAVHQMASFDVERARATFAIPAGHDPVTAIAIGYPADAASLPDDVRAKELRARSRKPLAEIVFAGTRGETAAMASSAGD